MLKTFPKSLVRLSIVFFLLPTSLVFSHTANAETWLPWPTRVCAGESFTQITASGNTRTQTGTNASYCRCTQGFEPKRENICRGQLFTASCKNSAWSHYEQVDFGSSLGTNWSPSTGSVCVGQSFTQTSSCGITRTATGTKPVGAFTPATSTQACGVSFTQTRVCGSSRTAIGTAPSSDWTPAPNTICEGESFTQTRSCGDPRTVVGTKPAGAFTPLPETVACGVTFTQTRTCGTSREAVGTQPTDDWTPSVDSVCYGVTFTQTRSCGTPQQAVGVKVDGECNLPEGDFDNDGVLNKDDPYPLQSSTQCAAI